MFNKLLHVYENNQKVEKLFHPPIIVAHCKLATLCINIKLNWCMVTDVYFFKNILSYEQLAIIYICFGWIISLDVSIAAGQTPVIAPVSITLVFQSVLECVCW